MSGSQWYFAVDGQQRGPVSSLDLRKLAKLNKLKPTDLVWKEGLPEWIPAQKITGLFTDSAEAAPRPVVTAVSEAQVPRQTSPQSRPAPSQPRKVAAASLPVAEEISEDDDEDITLTRLPQKTAPKKKKIKLDPKAAGKVEYAGFWLRVVASIIDSFIRGVIGGALSGGTNRVLVLALESMHVNPLITVFIAVSVSMIMGIAISCAYDVFQETSDTQATMGKAMLGLKVTDLNGEKLEVLTAVIRHFAKYVSVFTFGIGFLMAGFTEKKQALHDLIAGTLVVRVKN